MRIRKGGDLTGEDVAIMMILFKVGRLAANGDHIDSWIDLASAA
jgi:Domain of unknown function (DUF6378)